MATWEMGSGRWEVRHGLRLGQWAMGKGYRLVQWAVAMAIMLSVAVTAASGQTAEELILSGHVKIRHRLEPAEPVYIGQPVRLWIEVMTRTWFLEAPRYPDTIEVRNAIVIPPDAFGVNTTERIGGDT